MSQIEYPCCVRRYSTVPVPYAVMRVIPVPVCCRMHRACLLACLLAYWYCTVLVLCSLGEKDEWKEVSYGRMEEMTIHCIVAHTGRVLHPSTVTCTKDRQCAD